MTTDPKARRRLHDDVMGVVIAQLYYSENVEKFSGHETAYEYQQAMQGGVERYRADSLFRAKAMSMTAHLLQVIEPYTDPADLLAERDERIRRLEAFLAAFNRWRDAGDEYDLSYNDDPEVAALYWDDVLEKHKALESGNE